MRVSRDQIFSSIDVGVWTPIAFLEPFSDDPNCPVVEIPDAWIQLLNRNGLPPVRNESCAWYFTRVGFQANIEEIRRRWQPARTNISLVEYERGVDLFFTDVERKTLYHINKIEQTLRLLRNQEPDGIICLDPSALFRSVEQGVINFEVSLTLDPSIEHIQIPSTWLQQLNKRKIPATGRDKSTWYLTRTGFLANIDQFRERWSLHQNSLISFENYEEESGKFFNKLDRLHRQEIQVLEQQLIELRNK